MVRVVQPTVASAQTSVFEAIQTLLYSTSHQEEVRSSPYINLNVVIGCAGAIVGLFESAEDRKVNNSGFLIDHHSIAGRDEALTEPGCTPFASTYPLVCFIKSFQPARVKSPRASSRLWRLPCSKSRPSLRRCLRFLTPRPQASAIRSGPRDAAFLSARGP